MKTINKISLTKAKTLIARHKKNGGGRIFSARTIKRTTGEERNLICRFDVSKNLTGKGLRYDPKDYNLETVYDVQKEGYRSLNLADLKSLSIDGIYYEVE